jgi:hypothetical protein
MATPTVPQQQKQVAPTKKSVVKLSKEEKAALKASKFIAIGNRRVKNILKNLNGIKNLSNKSTYTYTDSQVDRIFNAIDEKIKDVKNSFAAKSEKKTEDFSL